MIPRNISNDLKELLKHFPIVLITGPRQVGKRTLLHSEFGANYKYVSLDDWENRGLALNDPKAFLQLHQWPLIIDEVQYAPQLFSQINALVNERRLKEGQQAANGMFILTGSQSFQLMKNVQESMAGRVGIVNLTCLSMNEIYGRKELLFEGDVATISPRIEDYVLDESNIYSYIIRGFFPALYNDPQLSQAVFYQSYINTYLERDLPEIIAVKDRGKFHLFVQLLASLTGCELVYDTLSNQVGVDAKTIKKWVFALEASGLVYLLMPYNEHSIGKRLVRRPKIYFTDTGLAAYLVAISDPITLQKSYLKGRFVETYIFNEIRKSYLNNLRSTNNFFYYRDNQQNEIDLIIVQDGRIHLFEMKSGTSFSSSDVKAFKVLEKSKLIKGNAAIICTANKISAVAQGIYCLPLSAI